MLLGSKLASLAGTRAVALAIKSVRAEGSKLESTERPEDPRDREGLPETGIEEPIRLGTPSVRRTYLCAASDCPSPGGS